MSLILLYCQREQLNNLACVIYSSIKSNHSYYLVDPQRLILSTSMCAGASITPRFSFLNVTLWLTIWRYRVLSWTHLTCILLVLSVCTCFISIMHSNDIVRFAFVLLLVSQLFENVNVYVNKGLHPWGEGVQTDVSKCKLYREEGSRWMLLYTLKHGRKIKKNV